MTEPEEKLAEVLDIRAWCRSFPPLPPHSIERQNLLDDLEDACTQGIELIVIEGEDGKGKTTLLAQFALRHPLHTIALFARPTSSHTYDPLYLLTDLCEQLHWLVYGTPRAETADLPDDGEYRMLLTRLEGRALHSGQHYYFLVDGLEEIPAEGIVMRDQLLELIPFGLKSFHFLYTGHIGALRRLPERVRNGIAYMQFPLARFTLDEATRYLAGVGLSEGDIRQINDLAHGLPGHLTIVRRLLLDGLPVERLMADLPTELTKLFDLQWTAIFEATPEDVELIQDILAILAHDRGYHTMGSLARLTNASVQRVADILRPLGFLRLGSTMPQDEDEASEHRRGDENLNDEQGAGLTATPLAASITGETVLPDNPFATPSSEQEVAFIPEAFRAYAARRLVSRATKVRERIVADLATQPLSGEALTRLPATLEELGRTNELLSYLSPDYFAALVAHQRSLGQALSVTARAIPIAASAHHEINLAQLSLMRSLFLELGLGGVHTEEIEAYLALGEEDRALALALSTPLVEDRLELLATIAKAQRMNGMPASAALHSQIEQVASQVDPDALGERAKDLGLTLLFSLPALGLRFLEVAEKGGTDKDWGKDAKQGEISRSPLRRALLEADPDLRDWLDAAGEAFGEGHDRSETQETFEALRASLSESATGGVHLVLWTLYGQQSAEDLLEALRDLPRPQDQIFVLGHWLRRNATHLDASRIMNEALDRILRHSDTVMPDAQAFRDIAEPLPQMVDTKEAARLIGRFDTFADLIERQSPLRDYVRLQMWLARAECRYDADRASSRLLQVWFSVSERDDLVERAACTAQVVAALGPITAAARAAEQRPPLSEEEMDEINASLAPLIDELLLTCADQYHAMRGVIRALAPRQPQRALELAAQLNTNSRRVAATVDVLRITIQRLSLETIAQASVTDALDQGLMLLRGTVQGDVALLWIAESAAALVGAGEPRRPQRKRDTSPDDMELTAMARLLPYLEKCSGMVGVRRRCRALALWEIALRRLMIRRDNRNDASTTTPSLNASPVATEVERQSNSVLHDAGSFNGAQANQPVNLPHGSLTAARLAHLMAQTIAFTDAAWTEMDPGWRTVALGFELAHLLAPDDTQRAHLFLQQAEQKRRDMRVAAHVVGPFTGCLMLTVRAFAGLLDQGSQTEESRAQLSRIIERLSHIVDLLPGYRERAAMWAEVAVRCFLHQQEALGREIVVTHIYRLLELISPGDEVLRRWAIAEVAPALYLTHQETAREWIKRVAPEYRAAIYAQIAQVLITRCPPGDPFTHAAASSRLLTYSEVLDVCRLIEDIDQDAPLYNTVLLLADGIVAGRASGRLSREHQREVAERVRTAIETYLPDKRNIQHDGYKLIALAQVARIDASIATRRDTWTPLAEAARRIPNVSDRAFVLAHLAVTTPSVDDRREWLAEAEVIIEGIPARRNRLEDYATLAHLVLGANWGEGGAAKARTWLRKAMETAAEAPHDTTMYSAQRQLIDLAYQFDESLARELAKRIDDDPARLAQRLRALDLKKRLADATSADPFAASGEIARGRVLGGIGIKAGNKSEREWLAQSASRLPDNRDNEEDNEADEERLYALVEACQMHLAALDAGRVPAATIERLREPLAVASQLPLSETYPIYVWALENAVRRLSGSAPQVRTILHPLFEAIAQVTDLAPRLEEDADARAARAARAAARNVASGDVELSTHIGPGDRDKAERVLCDWCATHPSPSLTLSDRYFSPTDLRWVRVLAEAMPPGCRITVLTSRRGQMQAHVELPWEKVYKLHWRLAVQEGVPPPIEIVILGTMKEGQAPFHDRYLIAAGAGLHFGVSFNALGGASDTIISALTPAQIEDTERDLDAWARGGAWEYKGERLLRTVFRLDDPDM